MAAPILVVGATGHVGREVVAKLKQGGHKVRVMTRDAARAKELGLDADEVVVGDLRDPASLPAAVEGVEKVYYATPDPEDNVVMLENFLAAAKAAGVRHVVRLSARSADVNSKEDLARRHGLAEQALEQSGLAWTHIRPSWFMQMMFEYAPGGRMELPGGEGRIGWIDTRDIADMAVAALTEPGHEGKCYIISGPEALSYGDLARMMSEATGRDFVYVDQTPEEYREQALARGDEAWYVDLVLQLYANIRADRYAHLSDEFEQVMGRPATTFDQFARDHKDELVKQLG
jgi:uncharacterized protein YbjT (DUF2867 family)